MVAIVILNLIRLKFILFLLRLFRVIKFIQTIRVVSRFYHSFKTQIRPQINVFGSSYIIYECMKIFHISILCTRPMLKSLQITFKLRFTHKILFSISEECSYFRILWESIFSLGLSNYCIQNCVLILKS